MTLITYNKLKDTIEHCCNIVNVLSELKLG